MAHLAAGGLHVDLPAGWDGRIARRPPDDDGRLVPAGAGGVAAPDLHVLQAASIPLPPGIGDFGGGVVELLRDGDVFLVLFEYERASAAAALFAAGGVPRRLRPADFAPDTLRRPIAGQVGLQRFFQAGGRPFCLYVVLAGPRHVPGSVATVNHLLGALTVT